MKVPSTSNKTNIAASNANSKMNNSNLQMTNNSMMSGFSATSVNTSVNNYDHKTFVKIIYADNKMLVVNSLCTCLHMLNHVKEKLQLSREDMIDFIDFDGIVKDIPNLNNKDYAIQYLTPTQSYSILKIEFDTITNEKRYISLLNESRLNANMTKTINNLNTGKVIASKDKNKQATNVKSKQLQQQQQQQQAQTQQALNNQNTSTPSSSVSLQQQSASSTSVNRRNSKNK